MATTVCAIIVAAGSGSRFGAPSKVFEQLRGRPVIAWSLDAFSRSTRVAAILIVAAPHTLHQAEELLASGTWSKLRHLVLGGTSRQDSVRNGLNSCTEPYDFVAIHDAARPLVHTADIDACIDMAVETGAAILATPVADTIKQVEHGRIVGTVPREALWAAQTPQVFKKALLEEAFRRQRPMDGVATDEAMLIERLGMPVAVLKGSFDNIKITLPGDLRLAEAIMRASGTDGACP